jgi:hypothetical protein
MLSLPDPVKYRGKKEETFERGFRFLVTGSNAAKTLDSGEEVFNSVSLSVVGPVVGRCGFRTLPFRDTGAIAVDTKKSSECRAIVAFVGNNNGIPDPGNDLGGNRDVVDVSGCDEQFQGSAMEIDQCVELGISPAPACPNSFTVSCLKRRSPVLMNPYVGAVDEAQSSFGPLGKFVENSPPNSVSIPPTEAAIHSLPGAESTRQISPRIPASENVKDPFEDLSQIALGSAMVEFGSGTPPASINFLSLLQSLSDRPR